LFTIQFTIVAGPGEGTRHEFQQQEVVIGSDFSSDLILVHPEVADRHARIVDEKDQIYLESIGASGETKLNGVFVTQETLHNGDELQVGPYVFHITLERGVLPDEVIHEPASQHGPRRKLSLFKRPPVLVGLSLFLIIAIYAIFAFLTKEELSLDLSLEGPTRLPVEGIFGYQVGGRNYVDKAEFAFVADQLKYRIQYRPGYISEANIVKIFINDKKLAPVPRTIDRWADEIESVEIPRPFLEIGGVNIIRLDNMKNPPETTPWGIRDISVHEVPIPKCDIDVAKKYIRLASEKYQERFITDSNLNDAVKYLREGQEYIIACEDTDVRNLLLESMDQYERELQGKYQEFMFNTKKFLKLEDMLGAKMELEKVMRYVPDETDRRHRVAKDMLEKVNRRIR